MIIVTRPFARKYLRVREQKLNLDSVVGQIGIVTSEITDIQSGSVKVAGKNWTAIAKETITVGNKVEILAIEGVKLVVKKEEK